jgi:hypothetical protein
MRATDLDPGVTEVVLKNEPFIVNCPVDLDLVKVEFPNDDALQLSSGASGRIGRIEIDTRTQDGIKVQNADQNAAHDLVVEGGYVKCHGCDAGAHQDGIQVMGGKKLTFRGIHFESADTQNIFVNKAGSGATNPTDIVFENCVSAVDSSITQGPATPVNINGSLRTVLRNCHVCKSPRYGKGIVIGSAAVDEVLQGNVEYAVGQCPDSFPIPGPDPGPDPGPEPGPEPGELVLLKETASYYSLGWEPVPGCIGYRFVGKSHTFDPDFQRDANDQGLCNTRFDKDGPFTVTPLMPGDEMTWEPN